LRISCGWSRIDKRHAYLAAIAGRFNFANCQAPGLLPEARQHFFFAQASAIDDGAATGVSTCQVGLDVFVAGVVNSLRQRSHVFGAVGFTQTFAAA
jgi:hypothetical protein